jgi:L-aspartate oxidase
MYDVCIIGTGIAGLTVAIKLSETNPNLNILCISKGKINNTNTNLAQGGIACVQNITDNFQNHINDTINAGKNLNDLETVKMVIENATSCISGLEKWGVNFDKELNGQYELGLEGGHSQNRIVHVHDYTGKAIQDELVEKIKNCKNINFLTFHFVYELIVKNKEVLGFKLINLKNSKTAVIYSKKTILATGGIGQFFNKTTNSSVSNGDGIVLAYLAGAKIKNLQYIQFHPTALFEKNKKKLFLISEAVRGEGAYILNAKNERFIFETDKRGELATRDIISNAIFLELSRTKSESVFLDVRHIKNFDEKFPSISFYLNSIEINYKKDLIPIVPAAHYQCGGIEVDLNGKTAVKNLYAIGECSETGLHGSNRLASNSLLEAYVYGENCCKSVINELKIQNNILLKKTEPSIQMYNAYSLVSKQINRLHKKFIIEYHTEIDKTYYLNQINIIEILLKKEFEHKQNSIRLIQCRNNFLLMKLLILEK